MLQAPREKMSFRGLEYLVRMKDAADMMKAALIGYYEMSEKEIYNSDAADAAGKYLAVADKLNVEMESLGNLLKKVNARSVPSPTAASTPA